MTWKEKKVIDRVRKYIEFKYVQTGWKMSEKKNLHEHGPDITMYNSSYGGRYIIEVKGYSTKAAQNYNSIYSIMGGDSC